MKRAWLFSLGGLNVGSALIQAATLVSEFAVHAPPSRLAFTTALFVANAIAAVWAFGLAREVQP